jgi:subtilisin family serine protease
MNIQRLVVHRLLSGLLLLAVGLASVQQVRAEISPDYVANEIVVKLRQAADLPAIAPEYGLHPTPLSQFGAHPIYRLRIMDGVTPPDKAEALEVDPRVQYVEPNYLHSTPEGQKRSSWARVESVSDQTAQWAVSKIRLPEAHTIQQGAGVTVAVLDTGVDAAHPALAGKLVAGYDFVDLDADPSEVGVSGEQPVFGHGTHIAGIIAVAAPAARIMPLRVLDHNGQGNLWVLAEALAYAVDPDGDPATADGAAVINLSLSTLRPTSLLEEVISWVTCNDDDNKDADNKDADDDEQEHGCDSRQGSVVVVAAGNNGGTTPEYPAAESEPGLLAVAATTPDDTRAAFSNYGSWVTIGAPGEDILSAIPGGQWGAWSGTSMATPFVAGIAALVRAAQPQMTPEAVNQQIINAAVNVGGDVPLRVDAAAALGVVTSASQRSSQLFLPLIQTQPTAFAAP